VGKFKFSLLKKAIGATFLILLPILITFVVSYGKNRELLEKHLLEDLSLISDGFEGQVYQFLEMAKRRTVDFATDGSIISVLKSGAASSDALSEHLLRNKLPIDSQIHAIAVISSKGAVVASTDSALHSRDFSTNPVFTSTRESATLIEMRHGIKGVPELAVSAPVKDSNGALLGIVTNFILLPELENVLSGEFTRQLGAITSGPGPRLTLEAYIVNRDSLMITGSKFIKNAVLKQKVDTEPVRACLESRQEITGFYTDYRGVEVAGASMCLPHLNWTLLVEIDSSEALKPVAAIGRNAIIAAVAVTLLISVLLLLFYRTIVAQLSGLSMAALRISEGDYSTRVPVKGTDEISWLAETFNLMASQISERNAALTESEERLKSILDNSSAIVFMKAAERPRISFQRGVWEDLGGVNFIGHMEPFVLTLDNGGGSGPNAMIHTGHEFVFCIRGSLEYQVENGVFFLEPGDSLIFSARLRHRWRNAGDTLVSALIILADFSESERGLSVHQQAGQEK
jgi:HAMP domain-containing protein